MKLGVLILPEYSWETANPIWQQAEAMGFDHAWTYDHLTWRSFRNKAWYSAIPTLTAVSAITSRIRLGTMVASPNFRHPLPFAKELITLDDISNGRITLGIGAGSSTFDATMLNQDPWTPKKRADHFAEFVMLTDQLLTTSESSYEGQHYSTNEARTYPGCVQKPRLPFAIAAAGKRGMKLAAQYGQIWITNGNRSQERPRPAKEGALIVRQQIDRLEAICEENGRDLTTLNRLVLTGPELDSGLDSVTAFQETIGRYEEVGVTDLVVHWPRPTEPYKTNFNTFEEIFSKIDK